MPLKAITPAEYSVSFTAAQWTALHAVFPAGVCDWNKPGVEQTRARPWASVGPSPMNLVFNVEAQ